MGAETKGTLANTKRSQEPSAVFPCSSETEPDKIKNQLRKLNNSPHKPASLAGEHSALASALRFEMRINKRSQILDYTPGTAF